MVTAREEGARCTAEKRALVVDHLLGLSAHRRPRAHHPPAEGLTDALVSETDSENGDGSRALLRARTVQATEPADRFQADPRLVGRAGARREHEALRVAPFELVHRDRVVAHDVELRAQLTQPLDEIVGERVVVIDDEDLRFAAHRVAASAMASSRPATAP